MKKKKNLKPAPANKSDIDQFEDVQRLVSILQVHQIELEHQNEELRIAHAELEQSRNKYVNLFDFSPIPYFTLNQDGEILELNLSASKMLGTDRKRLVGKSFFNFVSFEEREVLRKFLLTVFSSSVKQSCEVKVVNKEKELFFVHLEGLRSEDSETSTHYCQLALIDLTEKKDAEDSLKRSNEELKKLNFTRDRFYSIIAHDLRNPFHSLLGYSDLLCSEINTLPKEEVEIYSRNLNNDLKNIYRLLENLLQWSSMQRNDLQTNPDTIDLEVIVSEMVDVADKMFRKKNITLRNTVAKESFVYADVNMLRSIIQNLLSNAIKFTRINGDILISSVEKENFIDVSVKDSGIGIDAETLSHLFSFDRLLSTRGTDGEKGTGLGLPLCKEFVERNGGKIRVESEPGVGSNFIFTLRKASDSRA